MSSRDLLPDHPAELTLLEYLVGDLPAEACDRIRRHVASCRPCRRTIADLSLTVDELDRLPTVPIPHDTPTAAREAVGGLRLTRVLPVLAVLVAVGAVLGVLGFQRDARPQPVAPRPWRIELTVNTDGSPASILRHELQGFRALVGTDAGEGGRVLVTVSRADEPAVRAKLQALTGRDGPRSVVVLVAGTDAELEPVDAVPAAGGRV